MALIHRSFPTERQYCRVSGVVTPLVAMPIKATTPVLRVFSSPEMTRRSEQTMLASGERLTRDGDVGYTTRVGH
jgi:hypothetical protein